ncbi:MAG: hypothetical protein ABIQ16_03940 [Polyangiaceae bacterium]
MLASYPADGQGTNAELNADVDCTTPTPDCPVPTDAAIELRFDRFLLPARFDSYLLTKSKIAPGLLLYSGSRDNAVALRTEYDLVERVVVLRPARRLEPNALYTAEIQIGSDSNQGFYAFDRAPLEAFDVPLRFSFSTGSGPSANSAERLPSTDNCETMTTQGPLSSCAGCHVSTPAVEGGAQQFPPMGLDLSSTRGLYYTAVARVAHQTETGSAIARAGVQSPARFGVQMNIVDPGNPATSYLMYKLLQKADNFRLSDAEAACPITYHSPVLEGGCTPPDPDELTRVREWFVHGDPMPKDGRSADGTVTPAATDYANLRRIAGWITAGATCPEPVAPE